MSLLLRKGSRLEVKTTEANQKKKNFKVNYSLSRSNARIENKKKVLTTPTGTGYRAQ